MSVSEAQAQLDLALAERDARVATARVRLLKASTEYNREGERVKDFSEPDASFIIAERELEAAAAALTAAIES
jgi:hypothetical protein